MPSDTVIHNVLQPKTHLEHVRKRKGRPGHYIDPVTGEQHATPSRCALRRLLMPYATARDQLGWDLLLNRSMEPIWCRLSGGPAIRVLPGYVEHFGSVFYLYTGQTPEAECVAIGRAVLESWGIAVPANLSDWVA